ncbi:hypothetical protein BKA64DRAFT_673985 [Cadophora sp. MPI-SDFR-AT-0126]|nr:hypothetical protein BKA64DRAFT_673985 [Leotiomycetes sp. MPI-SDFR-AT-0126]
MDIKCSNKECNYIEKENFRELFCPALAANAEKPSSISAKPTSTTQSTDTCLSNIVSKLNVIKEADPKYKREPHPLEAILESLSPTIMPKMREIVIPEPDLPHCLKCTSLLRPGVVWFGESLSKTTFDEINT